MLIRIVKLTLKPNESANFVAIFKDRQPKIRAFDGCDFVELWQSPAENHVFFTKSHWTSEIHLNAYRNSAMFKSTWKQVKTMFAAKAEAWSLGKCLVAN